MLLKKKAPTDETAQRSGYGVEILLGLNRTGKHIYEGTVPAAVKAERRARNKRARQARAAHRRAAR